jgi:peptidoglycan/xylan/chitin deacetylase (PgdA/CDA1 family)
LRGTFYVPRDYWGSRLDEKAIRDLGARHEVGAHTLTHRELTALSADEARDEITGSKKWLEDICGKEVPMFCYPRGRFNDATKNLVASAGFRGARTTAMFQTEKPKDPFAMPTTVQVYPFPLRFGAGISEILSPLSQRSPGYRSLGVPFYKYNSWEEVTNAAFDKVLKHGEVFHIWGHSWEIEKYGLWRPLEKVLAHISRRADCRYVTNAELL